MATQVLDSDMHANMPHKGGCVSERVFVFIGFLYVTRPLTQAVETASSLRELLPHMILPYG
jgi:hypothetical protein